MFGLYLLKIFKTKFFFQKVSLDLSEGRGSSFSSEDSAAPASKPRAASLDTRLEVGGRCGGGEVGGLGVGVCRSLGCQVGVRRGQNDVFPLGELPGRRWREQLSDVPGIT